MIAYPQHTLVEWQVIFAAYLYECKDNSLIFMSDQSYDRESNYLKEEGTTIKGFDASTGQWIYNLLACSGYSAILEKAYDKLLEYDKKGKTEGTAITNLIDLEN